MDRTHFSSIRLLYDSHRIFMWLLKNNEKNENEAKQNGLILIQNSFEFDKNVVIDHKKGHFMERTHENIKRFEYWYSFGIFIWNYVIQRSNDIAPTQRILQLVTLRVLCFLMKMYKVFRLFRNFPPILSEHLEWTTACCVVEIHSRLILANHSLSTDVLQFSW